jgi:hypothetical protein
MGLGYRTILTSQATPHNRDAILSIFKQWATQRKGFVSLPTEGSVENDTGAVLSVETFSNSERSGYRWELVENWSPPKLHYAAEVETTSRAVMHITLVQSGELLWLWVDIDAPTITVRMQNGETRTEIQRTGTPVFVSQIINSVEMFDGHASPMDGFQIVPNAPSVNEILETVEDTARIGAVFVTTPPHGDDVQQWRVKSDERSVAMQGLGIGYVLTAEAAAEFNNRVAYGFRVPPGAMRTFLPGARTTDPDDAFRHKLMHAASLRDSDERRVQRILRNAQIERLRSIRLPDVLRDADYEFLRQRRLQPFRVLHRKPVTTTATVDTSVLVAEIEELRKRLEEAKALATLAIEEHDALSKQVNYMTDLLELERAEAEDNYELYSEESRTNEKLTRKIAYLTKEVLRLDGGSALAAEPDVSDIERVPETFAELLDMMGELDTVKFCGDRDEALALDEHTALGTAPVRKAWDAILTFDAYVRARKNGQYSNGLRNYIKNADHGFLVRASKLAWGEGETVRNNDKLSAQRTVPVDEKVSKDGQLMMVAHVKLSRLTGIAPRLYFHDTYTEVGYVSVGYLGAHLDNTQTN